MRKGDVRSQGGSKVKIAYSQCRTYRDKSKSVCSKHSIRAEVLEDAVFNAIKVQIALVSSLKDLVEEINRAPNVRNESQRLAVMQSAREKELEKVTSIKDSLYADWKNGDITKDDYRRLKAKYEEQAEVLEKAIAALREEQRVIAEGIRADNPYLQTFLKHQDVKELDRSIVVDLVDTIYVYEGGEVEIAFNFRDQHKLIMDFIESNQQQELRLIEGGKVS